jgi:hypothetical protein
VLFLCSTPSTNDLDLQAKCIRALLEGVVRQNVILLRKVRLPALYSFPRPVEWREESPSQTFDRVPDIVSLYALGHGDCAPIACARAAELRVSGDRATIVIYYRPERHPIPFHVEVRCADGAIEDPSRRLGMIAAAADPE